jgi:lipopolysaccharide export system protein LptA
MRNRVEQLRIWLLGGALVLMVVLAAFIGWARYLRRHYLAGLPARLGVNVVREADGYTLTKSSVQGRTLYRIHAAKAIEHTDGIASLHDVSITLYGKRGDRSDRIYGDEFEYDKNAQVVRATGVVHMDLESAEAAGRPNAKVTHVTTSGLVYLQKLGIAATSEAIEFETGGMTGHAVGADYSSDTGMLVLHSAVTLNGTSGGHTVGMTAGTAQFDQFNRQAVLTQATYESEGRKASADEATLDSRTNGTLSRIRAKGNVRMETKGTTITSEQADIALTAEGKPQTALLIGAVQYASERPLRQAHGTADEATIEFDAEKKPQPDHVVFAGAVHMTERTRAGLAATWSVRDLTARKVEASLAAGAEGKAEVRDVEATGNPRLSVVDGGTAKGGSRTELAADDLKAHLVDTGDAKRPMRVDTIVGRGHTLLRQVTADGGEQTVTADALDAKLRPGSGPAKGAAGDKLAGALLSSVQQGHVSMLRRMPAKAKTGTAAPEDAVFHVEHALADRAVYDGDTDRMTLSDGVQVSDAESVVWAKQIAFDHKTGDAHAVGGVKVSYVGSVAGGSKARVDAAAAEPTHVVADRADLVHASGVATFYGRPVRLWQGGNQVHAAVIELAKGEKRLVAHDDATGRGAQVETVLAGREGGAAGAGTTARACENSGVAKKGGIAGAQAGVTRIASGGLTYSGATGQANFTGGFRAETEDGTIRASEGVAYLRQKNAAAEAAVPVGANAASSNAATVVLSGSLDRVVASGGVELERPGLKATGTRLVYTASDGSAVLTGDVRTPPKAVGGQGTTTGKALRFRTSCGGGGSVEVVGSAGERVHTDATISDRKNGQGK